MRSELVINQISNNDDIIFRHDAIVNFFDVAVLFWSSSVTGPSFMSISLPALDFLFFYEGWTRNPEIGNTTV